MEKLYRLSSTTKLTGCTYTYNHEGKTDAYFHVTTLQMATTFVNSCLFNKETIRD